MTAKMVIIDDDYADKFEEFINSSNGHIEVIDDENLKKDSYFYKRKASLDRTIAAVDDCSMQMYSNEEYDNEMDLFMKELEKEYENN